MTPMTRSKTRTMMRLMSKCIGEKARLEGDGQSPMGPIPFHMPSYSFLTSFQSSSSSSPSSSNQLKINLTKLTSDHYGGVWL